MSTKAKKSIKKKVAPKKVAKAKPTVFDPKTAVTTVAIQLYDWSKVPDGTWFTATYNHRRIVGRIVHYDKRIYLVQNVYNGSKPSKLYNFRFGSNIGTHTEANDYLRRSNGSFTNITLLSEMPKGYVQEKFYKIGDYDVTINPGGIRVGCTYVSNEKVLEIAAALKKK